MRHAKAGPEWAISAIITVLGGIDRRIEVSDKRGFGAKFKRFNELQETPVLIYGTRNRRAACKIAGVEPTTRVLDGEDPTAFVLSANIHRRHMTKGQRAMAVAKIYPDTEQGKRKTSLETKQVGISKTNLSFARTVLQYAPDLAANVLTGSASLDDAYKTARARD